MGDPKQVKAVIQSIKQYKNFRQMAEYNISCLLTYITPPTVGWRENVAAAVADGGIESIIDVLGKHGNALDMVKQATTALSGMAISKENAGRVAQNGGIETALQCMLQIKMKGPDEEEVINAGSKLLETVARFNPESIMESPNAVQSILKGINYTEVPRVQTASARVLDRIGMYDQGLEMIVAQGGIHALCDSMAPGKPTHEDMLRPTFRLLERLARNPEYVAQIRANKGVEALVAQLDAHSDNEYILRAGGRLLAKIADSDIEETIKRLGGNLPDTVRQHLVGLLANLALQPENVEKIVKFGGIEALLKGFPHYNPATKAVALRALQRIAETGADNAGKIIDSGGLGIIIGAINGANGDEEILKAGVQALTSIIGGGLDFANQVHAQGGIASVLDQMMKFPDREGFTAAGLDFIEKLCAVGFSTEELVKMGAVNAIFSAMKSGIDNVEVQEKGFKALTALVSSADDKANRYALETISSSADLNIIPASLLKHQNEKGVVRAGVQTMAKLVSNETGRKNLMAINSLGAFIAAVYAQIKLEMLGQSRLSSDPVYVRNIKAVLAAMVTPGEVKGFAKSLVASQNENKTAVLQRVAVFSFSSDFATAMLHDQMTQALSMSLSHVVERDVDNRVGQITDHAVAIWSLAKTGLEAMGELFENGAVKNLLSASKTHSREPEAVIAVYRSLAVFAGSHDFRPKLLNLATIENCVIGMRSNAPVPDVQVAAIDLMIALSSQEAAASQICYKGGARQVLKMIKDSSTSADFETPIEKGLKLLYRVATVDKADVKEQLRNQGTVNVVTLAMSAFPTNNEILEFGAQILSLLMSPEDVADAIDAVAKLTKDLQVSKKPDKVFEQLGQKAATVGFLSLNPQNKEVMVEKNATGVTNQAIAVSKTKPHTNKRENAVRNEYRALGQISSVVGAPPGVVDQMLRDLVAPEEQISLMEKVGVLEAIKYLSNDPKSLDELLSKGAVDNILDLLKHNRSDERFLLAALDALSGLMSNQKGVEMVTKAGGGDLIFGILRDDADTLDHKGATAALAGLNKLASLTMNADKFINDGIVDTVTSTVEMQCEDSEEARPRVVGTAAKLLTTLVEKDEVAADQIVKMGAIKKLMDICESSPDYLTDPDCMQNLAKLLEALSNVEDLRPKMRELGAVDLMMKAMNMNPGNEELEKTGQRVLQKLVGGDASALDQTLADYDRLLEQVRRKPGNTVALERLNRAGVNLGNLMMVEGVVDAAGAAKIVERAMDTYEVVEKAPKSVGPIKEQILDLSIQNIGKATLIDGAMNEINMDKALALLSKTMANNTNPQMQIESLNALQKFLGEDVKVVAAAINMGMIQQLEDVLNNTASPGVKTAAENALETIREQVIKRPDLLLVRGPQNDAALAAILTTIDDPKDLAKFLQELVDAPYGADAMLRLFLDDLGSDNPKMSEELRKAMLKALGNAPTGVVSVPPQNVKDILKMISDPNVSPEEKIALLKLLADSKMTPAMSKALLDNNAIETILDMMSDPEKKDPNLLLAALTALAGFGCDPMLSKNIIDLSGAQLVTEVMKAHAQNQAIQMQGFETLGNLMDSAGGPEHLVITPDSLQYLESALLGLDPGARARANQLVNDLANMYNGEMEPMVVSRFDNMLDILNAAKDWREIHDPKTGKPYYYNVVTEETTWKKPAALIAAENALRNLEELAKKAPADIDQDKLRAAIGHFNQQAAEPLRLKALARALAALAMNDKNRDAMVQHGVLNALVKALNGRDIDREFILAAIALLNQFAKHKVYKEQICKLGGIKALIAIMLRFITDDEIVEKCEQCLANLAYNSKLCIAEIMECRGPEAVGQALRNHKDHVDVNLNAMSLLSNLMYQSETNKQIIGDLLRDRIVAVLRRMYKNLNVFKQTGRALGNIAFIDDHIRYVVRLNAVRSLIVAMDYHKGENSALKLGIDVIGNFASIDEEEFEQDIRQGKMVSVVSTIWHEGGAKKIVDTFGESNDPKIIASCIKSLMHLLEDTDVRRHLIGMNVVQMIFNAMQKYDTDQDISDFCIDSIDLMSDNVEGIQSIFENDGVSILLQQLELHAERTEYVQTVVQAFVKMAKLTDAHKDLSVRVLNDLQQQGGVDTLISVMETNLTDDKFMRITIRLLVLLTASRGEVSQEIAQKGMRIILKCVKEHDDNVEVLKAAYQLIGLLAFELKNLKIIVQYGGINLIVNSILRFPDKYALVKRSIQTLDNIAMASEEHSNIVKQARGKEVIDELIKTYETIPGEEARNVVKSCKAALLSLNKIETRKVNRELFFTDKEEADVTADPLKQYRTLLGTGNSVTFWQKNNSKAAHLRVKPENFQIIWVVPGTTKQKRLGKLDLKNLTGVRSGNQAGHGRRSNPQHAFALVSADNKVYCFECNSEEERDMWVKGFDVLKNLFRGGNKNFLRL